MKKIIEALDEATRKISDVIRLYDSPSRRWDRKEKALIDSAQQLLLHLWESLKDYQREEPLLAKRINETLRV